MSLQALHDRLPEHAKDLKLSLGTPAVAVTLEAEAALAAPALAAAA